MNRRKPLASTLAGIAAAPAMPALKAALTEERFLICTAVDHKKGIISYEWLTRAQIKSLIPASDHRRFTPTNVG